MAVFLPKRHNGTNNYKPSPFPIAPVLCFVKGHQDANCPYVTLSLPTQLNVDADHIAGSNVTEYRQPVQVQSHLEMPGILVQLGHIQRTSNLAPQIDLKWSPT